MGNQHFTFVYSAFKTMSAAPKTWDTDEEMATSTSTSVSTSASTSASTTESSVDAMDTDSANQKSDKKEKKKKAKKDKKKKKKKKKKGKDGRNLPPGYKRVKKELQQLLINPPVGITACPLSRDNLLQWIATIEGPEDTPYQGGKFYLDIKFGEKYPFVAPKVTFKTKIYHCNIKSSNGEICLNVLKDGYSPALTVEKVLLSIHALLQEPNPDDPLVADIAKVLIMDRAAHDENAREWTQRYAMVDANKNSNSKA